MEFNSGRAKRATAEASVSRGRTGDRPVRYNHLATIRIAGHARLRGRLRRRALHGLRAPGEIKKPAGVNRWAPSPLIVRMHPNRNKSRFRNF